MDPRPVLGPAESTLRVLDAIVSRHRASEPHQSIAHDYAVTAPFVDQVISHWDPEP